ncbi:MAG: hypothetical protein WCO35_03795 [Candidatus Nomurabacteria bacterium]
MKKLNFLGIITIILTMSSCYPGGDKKEEASTIYSDSGFLNSKSPIDFDKKLGISLLVKKEDSLGLMSYEPVFISSPVYKMIPNITDTTKVLIYYVENLAYGSWGGKNVSNEHLFNICTGYKIIKTK